VFPFPFPSTTSRLGASGSQPRKTLASQLDRLDGILDGLDSKLASAILQFSDLIVTIPDIVWKI
jgi:hypothetical protein